MDKSSYQELKRERDALMERVAKLEETVEELGKPPRRSAKLLLQSG